MAVAVEVEVEAVVVVCVEAVARLGVEASRASRAKAAVGRGEALLLLAPRLLAPRLLPARPAAAPSSSLSLSSVTCPTSSAALPPWPAALATGIPSRSP